MTTIVRDELSTFEWAAFPDSDIRSRGLNPELRVCYTGHTTFVRRQYLASIGKWGSLETSDMTSATTPHLAMLHVRPSAFRQFKARYGLMSKRQFECRHGAHPWTKAELCYVEHARAQRALVVNATASALAPVGTACAYAMATARVSLGLLAVEAVLWTSLFDRFLAHHMISVFEWSDFTDEEKLMVWQLGGQGVTWNIEETMHAPAMLHLYDPVLAAAE